MLNLQCVQKYIRWKNQSRRWNERKSCPVKGGRPRERNSKLLRHSPGMRNARYYERISCDFVTRLGCRNTTSISVQSSTEIEAPLGHVTSNMNILKGGEARPSVLRLEHDEIAGNMARGNTHSGFYVWTGNSLRASSWVNSNESSLPPPCRCV